MSSKPFLCTMLKSSSASSCKFHPMPRNSSMRTFSKREREPDVVGCVCGFVCLLVVFRCGYGEEGGRRWIGKRRSICSR